MSENFKVKQDGTVLVDGEPIGRAIKVEGVSMSSALGYGKPPVRWQAADIDGKPLITRQYDTRRQAAAQVVKITAPPKVDGIQRSTSTWSGAEYTAASLYYQGHYFGVTKYDTEQHWVVDFFIQAGTTFPQWANGEGTRVTRANVLTDELAALVDLAVAEHNVV